MGKIHNSNEEIRLCPKCKATETSRKYMREVVVLRKYKTVHYYRVMEHGRQLYRTLIFSSDWRYSLWDMPLVRSLFKPADMIDRFVSAEGSEGKLDFRNPTSPDYSLNIIRNLGGSQEDQQIHIPTRFLRGLLPQPLLAEYMFWQVCTPFIYYLSH